MFMMWSFFKCLKWLTKMEIATIAQQRSQKALLYHYKFNINSHYPDLYDEFVKRKEKQALPKWPVTVSLF